MQNKITERLQSLDNHFVNQSSQGAADQFIVDGDHKYEMLIDQNPDLKIKMDYFKMSGWGYKDTDFMYDEEKGEFKLLGSQYVYSGKYLPNIKKFLEEQFSLTLGKNIQEKKPEMKIDAPVFNHAFLQELSLDQFSRRSFLKEERIMHSHGHTLREVYKFYHGEFERTCDVVIYPLNGRQVEHIVQLANKHNVVIVPCGGGTNVTQSLMLQEEEKRMIVSLDMTRMTKILWVDTENMMAKVQAGILGQDLERELKVYGCCSGHEPDSMEFSTLGGWVSTKASGMKKNNYGNIEDIVQNITFVTSKGTYSKLDLQPRVSSGPDINHMIIGSEGNMGVVTDVTIKIKKLPQKTVYGSILFPNYETGIRFMEEVGKKGIVPTSIRLMDNLQFQLGQALAPKNESQWEEFMSSVKKYYVLNIAGFKADEMAACTILIEGSAEDVDMKEKNVYAISKKYGGMKAGAESGIKGYLLTYMIAYIRDFGAKYNVVSESFETSCPYTQVLPLCRAGEKAVYDTAAKYGLTKNQIFISSRVTQLYDTGAAVYMYFAYNGESIPIDKRVSVYEEVENACRTAIMKNGGSVSHHHGIGKIRKRFTENTLPPIGIDILKNIKKDWDPNNIFATNNTYYKDEAEKKKDLEH